MLIYSPIRWLLVQLGKLVETIAPGEPAAAVTMFFATPDIGGAERVHAAIVDALSSRRPQVYFTEAARNAGLLADYMHTATVTDLSPRLGSRIGFYIAVGRMARRLNRGGQVVFGAFSHFFYRLVPHLRPSLRCVDLIHNFGVQFEHFSLPCAARLDARVVITPSVASALKDLYRERGLDASLAARIRVIENAVDVPKKMPRREGPLRVLYVGRDTPEKRVHLISRIAKACREAGIAISFEAVGDLPPLGEGIKPHGAITDRAALDAHYDRAHVLLITSSREGFPMAVMEAMARGVVPLCTDVGGIPAHVLDGITGGLVDGGAQEAEIVRSMAQRLTSWSQQHALLARLSAAAYARACSHFARAPFERAWQAVLAEHSAAPSLVPAAAGGPA